MLTQVRNASLTGKDYLGDQQEFELLKDLAKLGYVTPTDYGYEMTDKGSDMWFNQPKSLRYGITSTNN